MKIAICGAHGTGKTTLAKDLSSLLKIPLLAGTLKQYWHNIGVYDFEKLPSDIRTVCQNYILQNFINTEDSNNEFVADRSVLDYLAYTELDTDMPENQMGVYRLLVQSRIKNYDLLIYCPIEFEVESEHLRADLGKREKIDNLIKGYLQKWRPANYLQVNGSPDQRVETVLQYAKNLEQVGDKIKTRIYQ